MYHYKFLYTRIISARFAPYARSVLAMDAENMQLYEATLASTAARNKIYESLRFLKNWRQRSILFAKCNIEVLKSARDDNGYFSVQTIKKEASQLEKITAANMHEK